MSIPVKFRNEDNGNCRVYYYNGTYLFCFQEDRPEEFTYYRCSRDGEPSHEVKPPASVQLPPGDTATGRNFIEWWKMRKGI